LGWVTAAAGALWLLGLASLTWQQVQIWKNTETLWRYAVEHTPQCGICNNNLGAWLVNNGFPEAGLPYVERSLAVRPDRVQNNVNAGIALANMGRVPEAVERFEKVVARYPEHVSALSNLGGALVRLGRGTEGLVHLERAIRLDPSHYAARVNLGIALTSLDRPAESVEHFRRAIALRPEAPYPHLGLCRAYLALGQLDLAREEWETLGALDRQMAAFLGPAFLDGW
jgi:superkiller protein 3